MTPDPSITVVRSSYDPLWRVSHLVMADESKGRFAMRGGIAWPEAQQVGSMVSLDGFALVAGTNVDTGRTTIFEGASWMCVDIRRESNPNAKPLTPLMLRWWERYFCGRYFWHGGDRTSGYYRRDIGRSVMLVPKPALREAEWSNDADASQLLWSAAMDGTIILPESIAQAVKAADSRPGIMCPARLALVALLVGINRTPWRAPTEDEVRRYEDRRLDDRLEEWEREE